MPRKFRVVLAVSSAIFYGVVATCLASTDKGAFFTSIPPFESGSDQTEAVGVSAFSTVHCARLCLEGATCLSFHYDEETEMCQISAAIITTSNGVMFSVDIECPASLGYKLYKLSDILLCIKIIATDVHQTIAKDDCENDGGHLLVIANEAMHLFVKTIVTAAGCGSVWVDGRDVYSNDTMFSWTGEQVPYINWAINEPSKGNQDCLVISSVRDFDFRDAVCSGTIHHGYICEM